MTVSRLKQLFRMRTVNPFDIRKSTSGFRGKENETNMLSLSQFADAPQS